MNPFAILIPIPFDSSSTLPERVKNQRKFARVGLCEAASRFGAAMDGWAQDEQGRPLPNGKHHWSVSHAKLWAAAVVSETPIGIDIEQVKPRKITTMDAIATDSEWQIVGERNWFNFFRIWTAKEAMLKSHGLGIGYLSDCRVVGTTRAAANSTPPGRRHDVLTGVQEPRASARADPSTAHAVTTGVQAETLILRFKERRSDVQQFFHDGHIVAVASSAVVVQWHTIGTGVSHALPD
jgi:4'-phosphopantetheinyl transferase